MSKAFGRIVLASAILAGAAVGGYAYLKKEGKLNEAEGENIPEADIEEDVVNDAANSFTTKARNYVDLASTKLEKPMAEAKEAMSGAKDKASEAYGVMKDTVVDVAKELKVVVSDASAKISDVVKEAKEDIASAAEEVSEEAADVVAEADAKEGEAEEVEFEEGLQAKKIEITDENIIGSDAESEEFFNDEEQ